MKGAFPCFSRIPGKMGMLLARGANLPESNQSFLSLLC